MKCWWLVCLALTLAGCSKTYTVGGQTYDDLVAQLANDDPKARQKIIKDLNRIAEKDPDAVPYLAVALQDPDVGNRRLTIVLLKNLGPMALGAIPALQEMAVDEQLGFDARNAISVIEGKGVLLPPLPVAPNKKAKK